MQAHDFFSQKEIQLPLHRKNEDFFGFVEAKLDSYLSLVDQLVGPVPFVEAIRDQKSQITEHCTALKQAVQDALLGQPADAYAAFNAGISQILPYVQKATLSELGTIDIGILYRVRRQIAPPLSREQLFHIPFEDRHRVATQRYSIPGLPCLYLGGSLYTCWAEMGLLPFHELQAAAFWVKSEKKVNIIDLSNRPARLLRYYFDPGGNPVGPSNIQEKLAHYVIMWPLMALCSIIVKHRDSPFKPEYIIPQLFLQWITQQEDLDGICYFSNHVKAITNRPLPVCNFVFPARKIKANGRCSRLRDLFKMTEPQGWELLSAIMAGGAGPGMSAPHPLMFEFIENKEEEYQKTNFGIVEAKLNSLVIDVIRENNAGNLEIGDVED